MMKYCPDCEEKKGYGEFSADKSTKDKLYPYCKECTAARARKRYQIIRRQWREFVSKILPPVCSNCGYDKSQRAINYHHLNPEEKSFGISKFIKQGLTKKNKQLMRDELDKCICLCANCHAELHDNDYEEG